MLQNWRLVDEYFVFYIRWKYILVGFYRENDWKSATLDFIISLLARKIYKYKMYCSLEKLDENEESLKAHLKSSLLNYASV